jgi:hypothetical protein
MESPPLTLLETCWRMKGPSNRGLGCAIYKHMAGVEVRCGYGEDDLLRSQTAPEIGTAREIAEQCCRLCSRREGRIRSDSLRGA